MRYQTVQSALVSTLGTAAAGRYRVVGYDDLPIDSSEVSTSATKLVSVVYKSGILPTGTSPHSGPATHTCTFNISLLLSSSAKVNLAVLESDESTAAQRTTALAALQDAKNLSNADLDSFISIIFGVLLDNRNINIGLSQKYVGNRWITKIQKNDPEYFGDCVISTATLEYEIDVEEDFVGDTGESGDIINLTLKLNDEPTDGQAGVSKGL